MFISEAFAQGVDAAGTVPAPNPMWNFGLLAVMVCFVLCAFDFAATKAV